MTPDQTEAALMSLDSLADQSCEILRALPIEAQVTALNSIRAKLHEAGPFAAEPVDLVLWVDSSRVKGNDYNPNRVAPPEMQLLRRSIIEDGYTQPVVASPEPAEGSTHTVVDGFHRSRIARESKEVRDRVHGYLPLTEIRPSQSGASNRMASTIRHNRARGEHDIQLMMQIVAELVQSGMSDQWIMRHIGMDADELLRLKQVTGIAALFKNRDFSAAWAKDAEDAKNYD